MLYDIIASVKNKRILNRKKHVYEKNLLNDNRAVRKYNMEVAVLKKLVTVLGAFFAVLLACPLSVFAAEGSKAPSTVPVLIFNMVILLFVFYQIDKRSYRKDIANGRKPDIRKPGTQFRLDGLHNIIFLVMIVGAVILSGVLPGMSAFQDAAGNVRGIHLFGEVTLTFPALIEIVIILLAAFLSFKTTDKQIRIRNHFTWGAIQEVAVLFIGIFITMQPALMLLKAVGPNLGVTEPAEMFWATGALSSFLDNTPTYLVFLTTAGTLAFTNGITTTLGTVPTKILSAISCGAVFMGANTYIGNAPNFMVKAISDENGVKMPSFFGYMLWSVAFLIPVFVIDMFVFFL